MSTRTSCTDRWRTSNDARLDRLRELVAADRSLIGDYSGDGFPVLALAAFFGRRDAVVFLLAKGADAGAKNDDGVTPCDLAVRNHHEAMATLLREPVA